MPLDRLSTAVSIRNQPPSTISAASCGSRRPGRARRLQARARRRRRAAGSVRRRRRLGSASERRRARACGRAAGPRDRRPGLSGRHRCELARLGVGGILRQAAAAQQQGEQRERDQPEQGEREHPPAPGRRAPCRTAAPGSGGCRTGSGCGSGRWAGTSSSGPPSGAPRPRRCARSPAGGARRCTRAPGFVNTCPGPPIWPSTRPKPLYSNVSPSSVLFVELPTYGRFEAGVSSTKAIHENDTTTITTPATSSLPAAREQRCRARTRRKAQRDPGHDEVRRRASSC